nr:hypothetical protein [Micromonospora sp. DSM 115978]
VTEFVNLVLAGLVTGALYAILASGLTLTYQTSGVFNFGQGAVAFATAYLFFQLNSGQGLPIVPSAVISIAVFAPLLGLLLHRLLFKGLREAPIATRMVATIGLLIAIALGMLSAILMRQATWLERSLFAYAVILQSVQILALVPMLGLWFGFG